MVRLTHSEDYYVKILLSKTKIKEIMTKPPISLKINARFSRVVALFNRYKIRHLPIVNNDGKIVGLMTQRHLYKIQSPRKLVDGSWYYDKQALDNIELHTVMITNPLTLHPEDSISDALVPMVRNKYGCIPIVDKNDILCGIITQHDILKAALQISES
jgi:CBS domain-containing protein